MKSITCLLMSGLLLASCSTKTEVKNSQQLIKLKKDRTQLDEQIRKLEAGKKDSVQATPVTIMAATPGRFTAYIEVQSQVTGDENVVATPRASGTVTQILVQPGQQVGKGQLLATLDASTIDQQIMALAPQLNLQKTMYQKQQRLWAQQIGSEMQLLSVKAQYESTQKQRSVLESQRNMFRIVSPISGVVDAVNLKVGEMAAPGMVGIRVVSTAKLKAEAMLGENYIGKVRQGDPVTILFNESGDSIQTRLSYVGQAVDPVSRSFPIQVRLGSNNRLHPNMSCRMRITNYENNHVITIPVSVIQKTGGGDIVYIANGNIAKAVTVQTGRTSNGQVEVLSGLQAGDQVITEGFLNLNNGVPVAVQ